MGVRDSKAVLCHAGAVVQFSIDSTYYTRIRNSPYKNDLHEIAKEEGMGLREELIDWATEFLILASDGVWKTVKNLTVQIDIQPLQRCSPWKSRFKIEKKG